MLDAGRAGHGRKRSSAVVAHYRIIEFIHEPFDAPPTRRLLHTEPAKGILNRLSVTRLQPRCRRHALISQLSRAVGSYWIGCIRTRFLKGAYIQTEIEYARSGRIHGEFLRLLYLLAH